MYLDKFVHSLTGRYIMSVILGIGLATFFRAACYGKNCTIETAPPMEQIDAKIYKFDQKCYKLTKNPVKCSANKKIIDIDTVNA